MFSAADILAWLRRHRLVLAIGVIGLAAITGWLALQPQTTPQPQLVGEAVDPPAPATVLVFVSGAVAHPGLYQLSPDARVADAIAAAGGITANADPGHLPDLAARVHDGRQVNVPFLKSTTATALKLDINSAALDELQGIPGMPPGLAEAIVQYRDTWGPLTSMSQLRTDLGVDSATVTGLEHYLKVAPPTP